MQKIDRITLSEQVAREIDLSRAQRNAARLHYYTTINWDSRAFASYESFVGSWAHQIWLQQNQSEIDKFIDEQYSRFQQKWTC